MVSTSIFPSACEVRTTRSDLLAVEKLDLLDQPVQAKAHCGIADTVDSGHLLQGTRRQDEPLDERQVFVAQKDWPLAGVP